MGNWYHHFTIVLVSFSVATAVGYSQHVRNDKTDEFVYTCTEAGVVRGRKHHTAAEKNDVITFLGIPYAAAPVGPLRFSRPSPVRPWKGVYDALRHGPKCIQILLPGDPILEDVPFSEDCLYLDVYTPSRNQSLVDSTKMAVMMFIHGGSFYGGTGAKYNFTNVALKGVVVVTINYRLGVFGFLSTEDDVIPGNFGMLDMVMALDWVKKNIAYFGGDPGRITLFGASSGSACVSLLTLSPLSRGKFQRAIMQSGVGSSIWGARNPNATVITSLGLAKAVGQILGCHRTNGESESFSKHLLACLRHIPAHIIVLAAKAVKATTGTDGIAIWVPVVEQTFGFLPDSPLNLLHDSSLVPIPTIRGYLKNDGNFIVKDPENDGLREDELRAMLNLAANYFFPENTNEVLKLMTERYFPRSIADTASKFEMRDILLRFATDLAFISPIIRESILLAEANLEIKSYVFELDLRPSYTQAPLWMGVAHESEKGYVLDLPQGPDPFKYPNYTDVDFDVAELISTLWTNFAKYGNPTLTPVDGLVWDPFVSHSTNLSTQCDFSTPKSPFRPNRQYKILRINAVSEMSLFDHCETVNFWSGIH